MKEFPNRRANMGFANLGGYFCTHVGGAGDFFFWFLSCVPYVFRSDLMGFVKLVQVLPSSESKTLEVPRNEKG